LFAVFIIVNCEKWWEAALKCFVFFLISQPLIYLIEVPFFDRGWEIFNYYGYWFKITLLTLPGAVIAFQLKRKNWLSVLVLCVPIVYLTSASLGYYHAAMANFPQHLLSALFAVGLAIFFIFVLLDRKAHRIVALSVLAIAFIVLLFFTGPDKTEEIVLEEGNWTYSADDESVVTTDISDGNHITLTAKQDGNTLIRFKNSDGIEIEYYVTVSGGGIWVNRFDEQ